MSAAHPEWLEIHHGDAPLIISLSHTGTDIPSGIEAGLVSAWLARKDTDWWIDKLYDFASGMGATIIRTRMSRTVIDVNRDPSGISLYPGQATTELCPTTSFDGEPLYSCGQAPDAAETSMRQQIYFEPYHAALQAEIVRLRSYHAQIVLYDCHSIRSVIPRLFEGELPQFNIGTNSGASCSAALTDAIVAACSKQGSGHDLVVNGRFKGGFITRKHGQPQLGVHGVQMELACRGYMVEHQRPVDATNWPSPYDPAYAAPMRATLVKVLDACLNFASRRNVA